MRIAILGTRGIPNHYGGFEQCAEYLALGLVKKGFEVVVYSSHNHPYQEKIWNGVQIVHCYDPEDKIGTAGQFVYDLNCILDLRRRKCDVLLQLGYTSSSVWGWLIPKDIVVTTNMDGLEWKRTKFSNSIKRFLQFAESLAIKYSDYLISDSLGIQDYLQDRYIAKSTFIAYGATLVDEVFQTTLGEFNVLPYSYDMLVARLEPENSIEIILDGVVKSNSNKPFLVIGKYKTKYGKYLTDKYSKYSQVKFIGGVYDIGKLNDLRHFSNLYFHGHTVGGTNPSLLEAMASSSLICANDNPFNKYILGNDALYFKTSTEVSDVLTRVNYNEVVYEEMIKSNRNKITALYDWQIIINQYASHFELIKGKVLRK